MNRFTRLWSPYGSVSRGTYAVVGIVGFALKHNLDRFVASFVFSRRWGIFNYWVPVRDVARITQLPRSEAIFLATMVALSLPFVWLGVTMTMKRLRSAGLPPQRVALFFLPFLNLIFFLVLCLLPEKRFNVARGASPEQAVHAQLHPMEQRITYAGSSAVRILPESALGSAAISLLMTVPIGFATAWLGTQILSNYGWGLFVALPFIMGLAAALTYGARQPRGAGAQIGVACL